MKPSATLARVAKGDLCCGCGGCAALAPRAIAMETVPPGYLRPRQTGEISAETDARIDRICPGTGLANPVMANAHPLWGGLVGLRTGHAVDPALRHKASSGGALSAILAHLIAEGRVDGVLQTAASPDLPFANATVLSETAADVMEAAGSRYAPSAPLAGIEAHLTGDRRLAFVGKPCDAAALRLMGRDDPRVAERFPFILSFFCAGVPSLTGARGVLAALGVEEAEVAAFRYRGEGWPGRAAATLRDGTRRDMSYADSWGGILSKHLQFRCKICPDGTGAFADIVCADAWETDERGYPLFEEQEGISLIVSRTPLGEEIVREAMTRGSIEAKDAPVESIEAMQPGQTQKRRYALARLLAMRLAGRPAPRYEGFSLLRNALRAGVFANLKNFLGTFRRVVRR